jgi:hypothetical protein
MTKRHKVQLTLKTNEQTAMVVAKAVIQRANPHYQTLIEDRLDKAEITVENMAKYFQQIALVTADFWNAGWDMSHEPVLRSHEVRGLYLPTIMGVIFSSIGNLKLGGYEYLLVTQSSEGIEKDWLFNFSATLEENGDLIKGNVGQIGNYAAQPQQPVMLSILGEIASDNRSAEMLIRDGVNVDNALAGLSVLAGLSLINEAYTILYTGVEEVNFREVTETIVDKGLLANRTNRESE